MGNLAITYQNIADILSFETPNSKLEKDLSHPAFDWDAIVIEGSKHLVLPAIYCRLKAKQLLHVLPEELHTYLEELTSINRNRNEALLSQVHSISKLLNEHQIEHAFLKGSALLALSCFADNAERMIGDIDILVSLNQIDKANHLLKNIGYKPIEQTLGNDFFEHKHMPRMKTKLHVCAVELHRKLFVSYTYHELTSETILNKKIKSANIYIPSQKHLLMHTILNFQINDKGALFNSISFRSAYDTIALQRDYKDDTTWYGSKIFKSYFNYTSLFFKDIKIATKAKSNFLTFFYLFKLKHITFYRFWNKLLNISSLVALLLKRLSFFVSNRPYRKAIINDRKRVFKHFKSILNKF